MGVGTGLIMAFSLGLLVYGLKKFNTWTTEEKLEEPYENPPRHFTTWWRFNFYAFLYSSAIIVLYLLCVLCPELVVSLAVRLGISLENITVSNNIPVELKPVIAGTVIFMPVFGYLLKFEIRWRRLGHELAFIPDHAKAIINGFKSNFSSFKPDMNDMKTLLKSDGILSSQLIENTCNYYNAHQKQNLTATTGTHTFPETFTNYSAMNIAHLWAKVYYLKTKFDMFLTGFGAARCLRKCEHQRSGLNADYKYLRSLIIIYFALNTVHHTGNDKLSKELIIASDNNLIMGLLSKIKALEIKYREVANPKKIEALNILTEEINKGAQKTLSKLYLISCCAVLKLTKSEKHRSILFEYFGLHTSINIPKIVPVTAIMKGLGSVFLLGLAGTLWFHLMLEGKAMQLPFIIDGKLFIFPLIPKDSINVLLWPFYTLALHGIAIFISMDSVRRFTYHMNYGLVPIEEITDQQSTMASITAVTFTFIACSAFLCLFALLTKVPYVMPVQLPVGFNNTINSVVSSYLPLDFVLKVVCLWALVPATTALFAVVYLKIAMRTKTELSFRDKALYTVYQGALTGGVGVLATVIFLSYVDSTALVDSPKEASKYFGIYVGGMTTAIGLILGYILPRGYENYLKQNVHKTNEKVRKFARAENIPAWVG